MDYLEPGVIGTLENPQRKVLPNRGGKAVGCFFRSGQEGCITLQRCYGITNHASLHLVSQSVTLLSISTPHRVSSSRHHPKNRSYRHSWCFCLRCSPCHPSGSAHQAPQCRAHLGPLLLRKHLPSMCNPLPPHCESTGKASSSFVVQTPAGGR